MMTTRKYRMWSIALFPCSHTDGAKIIGELITSLHLSVYTDGMLFSEVSEQFGIPADKMYKEICKKLPPANRRIGRRKKYINCLKWALAAQTAGSGKGRLYYGLHTSLLNCQIDRVLKILVYDDPKNRVKRAMHQEGFSEKRARDQIRKFDDKVSRWTAFLFEKGPYDRSLHDIVIPWKSKNLLEITALIIQLFESLEISPALVQAQIPQQSRLNYSL